MIGKVTPDDLDEFVFTRTGASDDDVVQGPAYGEDTAAIDIGGQTLVVNSDPISLAVDRVGTLGVNIACNDVAASGGVPRWLNNVVFLPPSADDTMLDRITAQLDAEASRLGVAIVGGHSEYAPALDTPLLVVTCLGLADRYVPSSGAKPGDRVILTKSAAIEATAIIASDFRDRLGDVPREVVSRAESFYDDVSVLPDAAAVTPFARAMHDPTEGGLVDGLLEMAAASGVELDVEPDSIPVRDETRALCAAVGVDPLRTFGSGALVAAVGSEHTEDALAALDEAGVRATVIGEVVESDEPCVRLGDETVTEPGRDAMYPLWE